MQVPRLSEEKCEGKAWSPVRQWFLSCDEDTDKRQKQKIERHQKSVLPSTQSKTWGGGILQNGREYYQTGKQLRDKVEVQIKSNN